jgi:cyclopropane fatty-acyl-phospholipid synthase-like methyltransferase
MTSNHRFANLGFEDFRRLAQEDGLSMYERIGFPDSYRRGHEAAIFADICQKLPRLRGEPGRVLDIGPGCSDLPRLLIQLCDERGHELTLIDSAEMLAQLPAPERVKKISAMYPNCLEDLKPLFGKMDAIVCYSVLHYVLVDVPFFRFVDTSLALLAPGGGLLIGDVPNVSKRKRFFSSDAGVQFHRQFMNTADTPEVRFNQIEHDQIDDAVVLAIVQRARAAGFDAYVVPQAADLPMANRREDILIVRP